jgi:mRNA interferase MazF
MVAPDRGDLIWISVDTRNGTGSTRRPALVVSPARYNDKSGLALMCAIASRPKGYPFEVALPEGLPVAGVILADHLRSADWKVRSAEIVARAPEEVVAEVLAKLKPL